MNGICERNREISSLEIYQAQPHSLFYCFRQYWGLNSGLHTLQALYQHTFLFLSSDMAQVVMSLPSKLKALSLKQTPAQKKKKFPPFSSF
jgi:hypothetical protein